MRSVPLDESRGVSLKVSEAFDNILSNHHRRDVRHDDAYCMEFRFSSRRNISVYIEECEQSKHGSCFVATIYIFDPSLTTDETSGCWDGMRKLDAETFSAGDFVSELGLASLHGGLASVRLELHFDEKHVGRAAHKLMHIAGLVDMYTR